MMRHGIHIEPLDVLFFRDGRPFEAASRASSGLPSPQTLAGAIRTTLLSRTGFDFAAFSEARKACSKTGQESREALKKALRDGRAQDWIVQATFRGPWPALFPSEQAIPLFSQPLDRVQSKERTAFVRLKPERIPGWNDDELLPLVRDGSPNSKADPKLFSLAALKSYLKGEVLNCNSNELFDREDIYDYDNRTGIAVDADTLTSAEGMIYGVRFLALKPNLAVDEQHGNYSGAKIGLYAEIECNCERDVLRQHLADPIPFGGESRYVRLTVGKEVEWPSSSATATKTKWLLVSPAFIPFSAKSNRPLPQVDGLKAAISGAGIAISGWDVAKNGPRETRFAIPAGAVYFFDGAGPKDGFLGGSEDDKAEGWGFALPGTWEEKQS